LETGIAIPRNGWLSVPIWRAMASAPPPAPQVTMKSMGRDGNFSWAGAGAARANTAATTAPSTVA
jgi:hypothetical protein